MATMTRKEKEQKLLETFDLELGSKVKIGECIYKIVENGDGIILQTKKDDCIRTFNIAALLIYDWKKLEPSIADKRCRDIKDCADCPFRKFVCVSYVEHVTERTLEEIYNEIEKELFKAKQEIYGGEE